MPAQGFLTTIAGMSLSLAGFASLIAWLRDDQTRWDAINLWRVKTIVRHALTLVALTLGLHPVHELTGDAATTVRIGSAALSVFFVAEMVRNLHRDPEIWPAMFAWRVAMVGSVVYLALQLTNLGLASVGVLEVGFVLALMEPAGIFYNFVNELGGTSDRQPTVTDSESDWVE